MNHVPFSLHNTLVTSVERLSYLIDSVNTLFESLTGDCNSVLKPGQRCSRDHNAKTGSSSNLAETCFVGMLLWYSLIARKTATMRTFQV